MALASADGLPAECVAAFDNLLPVSRSLLTQQIGGPCAGRRQAILAALAAFAGC